MARFRCTDRGCGWKGLLTRHLDPEARPSGGWHLRAWRGIVPLWLSAMAIVAAQWGAVHAPVANVAVGARHFAPGEAFDGETLPPEHPLLVTAGFTLPAPAGIDDGVPPETARPLALRRFCAWGRPGRMPFRGSVDEALRAARLPPVVRQQIGAAIAAARPHDRLVISNDAIRTASGTRKFAADGFAMTYGRTLCLGTRVNFKPGHREPASLYEAFGEDGQRYSVMVPDVCGNVSVLRPHGESAAGIAGASGAAFTGLDPLDPGQPEGHTTHAALSAKPNEVATPGTLALALLALAAAGRIGRRRACADDAAGRGRLKANPPGAPR